MTSNAPLQDRMDGKPQLSFWQIWNMSFGFLGIQFGFALQGGFMSRIFQTLGAEKDALPLLWIAAPLTGLLVQPVIGYLSDRTWHPLLGRRRPYFLVGAILSSLALVAMPHSSALWMAAGLLWVLDASINISMEPFRALVADKLPERQRSYGFVLQTLIIGIGTWVASSLPWLVAQFGVPNEAGPGVVPPSVKLAFSIGACVFLASILVTVFTTREYPPPDLQRFRDEQRAGKGLVAEVLGDIRRMPQQMRAIGLVQFFSWLAFFSMWSMATPGLTEHVFGTPAPDPKAFDVAVPAQALAFQQANGAFQGAADLVGSYMGYYGLSSMLVALLLSFYAARRPLNRRLVHFGSLLLEGQRLQQVRRRRTPSNPGRGSRTRARSARAWPSTAVEKNASQLRNSTRPIARVLLRRAPDVAQHLRNRAVPARCASRKRCRSGGGYSRVVNTVTRMLARHAGADRRTPA